jgi:hypothetical protein
LDEITQVLMHIGQFVEQRGPGSWVLSAVDGSDDSCVGWAMKKPPEAQAAGG